MASPTTAETAVIDPAQGVVVKGWRNGLLLILPLEGVWNDLLGQVDAKLDEAKARSFWRGAQVTIDCGPRDGVTLEELSSLTDRLKRAYGLVPVAVVSADPVTRAAGEKLALVAYEEMPVVRKPVRPASAGESAAAAIGATTAATPRQAAAPVSTPAAPPAPAHNALYVPSTVRSGQRVVHEGHLVIAGDVNAGAEVMAGGDILVFGTLRGLAHAGCYGDESARILAGSLRPPQLRIAGKIARSPEEAGRGGSGAGRAQEVARIENGEIEVFPL